MKGSSRVSILQGKEKRCFATIESGIVLHKHHIFYGSGHRKISDKHGLWVWLKPEKHNIGRESLHMRPGHGLDLELKQRAQRAFEAEYGHEEFMKVIGRNYLETYEELPEVTTLHEEQEELPQVRTQLVGTQEKPKVPHEELPEVTTLQEEMPKTEMPKEEGFYLIAEIDAAVADFDLF